jgi:hypothetical protein
MAIPEAQLETWSHQGAPGPSRQTYSVVKSVLEDKAAPYAGKEPEVFLQGSYANDTNVARDSDVDVVVFIAATFGHDANTLVPDQYQAFSRAYPSGASYSYGQYKVDVARWLSERYGSGVRVGHKAIYIPPGKGRRECDVLPAIEYRYYYRFNSISDQSYAQGICFYLPDGTQIVNFAKQHSDNCTVKHQLTESWFKPTVRLYKNMRNHLVDSGLLKDGVAPSYFIEGMLYNVPNALFGKNFSDTLVATLSYVVNTDRSKFRCANGIHMLLGNSPVTWSADNCEIFLGAVARLWNGWR